MKLYSKFGPLCLVLSFPMTAIASLAPANPVRDANDLHNLPGRYVSTDCEDTIRQPNPQDNLDYTEQSLTIRRRGADALSLEFGPDAPLLFRKSPVFSRINQGPKGTTESYTTHGGVFKSARTEFKTVIGGNAAERTVYLDTWKLDTEGYDGAGIVLRAHHINESAKPGENADKMLVCHYARITTR